MPEYPDIEVYIHALAPRVIGQPLEKIRIASPFLLRSVTPSIRDVESKSVRGLRRLGKRIVFCLDDEIFVVIHLMIAGRLHWKAKGIKIVAKIGLAAFDFPNGALSLTEASSKKRAGLFLARGEAALRELDPGGLELFDCSFEQFKDALVAENHSLKRTLTDPHVFSGIGNAYSDEILHRAKLSPVKMTKKASDAEIQALFDATRDVMREWKERLIEQAGAEFPEGVTAFRPEMTVHGKFGQPCPVCGAKVQRIVYAENEANYCAKCQTGGKLLADRALSRLLKGDWPKTLEEMEEHKRGLRTKI